MPFWQAIFCAAIPNIIGQQVTLADKPYTITGVMPRGWKFPVQNDAIDYIAPLYPMFSGPPPNPIDRRGAHFLPVVGRMKPGDGSAHRDSADLQTIAAQLAKQYPDTNAGPDRTRRVAPIRYGRRRETGACSCCSRRWRSFS